jgi:hypothetical protein
VPPPPLSIPGILPPPPPSPSPVVTTARPSGLKKLLIAALIASLAPILIGFGFLFLRNPRAMTGQIKLLLQSAPAPIARFFPPAKPPEPGPESTDQAAPQPDASEPGTVASTKANPASDLLSVEHVSDFIHSYYEGVENKDLNRVAANYDAVVACGPQGLRTRTAIRNDLISYFAQYRSLLISIESVHVDVDPLKDSARATFTLRYKKIPEVGTLNSGLGTEKWTLVVRENKLAISAIEEKFFAGP